MDLERAVAAAWARTAGQMPGVRMVLDHHRRHPADDATAGALARAVAKERHFLAVMGGRAGLGDAAAQRIGAEIEERGRELWAGAAATGSTHAPRRGLVDRLRAVVAA
ncbi:hypothetical protein [Nocardioides sp. TF02-7]|uniref:hypothetical protein n=1 Tax=Nocardioides sp. TF02-7 TaxID=2917724 RepID=UPI001F059A59|nr:hypothetical protein [Nocardioides sp. TF02-7]UMG91636.1 hypothetical protein MF408_16265 [Nocardioides sp. TF02-7]